MAAEHDARAPQDQQDRPERFDRIPERVGDVSHRVEECSDSDEENNESHKHASVVMVAAPVLAILHFPLLLLLTMLLLPLLFLCFPFLAAHVATTGKTAVVVWVFVWCACTAAVIYIRTKDAHVRAIWVGVVGLVGIWGWLLVILIHIPIISHGSMAFENIQTLIHLFSQFFEGIVPFQSKVKFCLQFLHL